MVLKALRLGGYNDKATPGDDPFPGAEAAVAVSGLVGAVQLFVQIPFVGPSALQAVLGTVAVGLGGLAVHARRSGWRSVRPASCPCPSW